MFSEYVTGLFPEPRLVPPDAGALVPNTSLQLPGIAELYLNQPVVETPLFGFAEPFNAAVVVATGLAVLVVTMGAACVAVVVGVNVRSLPNSKVVLSSPPSFETLSLLPPAENCSDSRRVVSSHEPPVV